MPVTIPQGVLCLGKAQEAMLTIPGHLGRIHLDVKEENHWISLTETIQPVVRRVPLYPDVGRQLREALHRSGLHGEENHGQ